MRAIFRFYAVVFILVLLLGCSPRTVYVDRVVEVKVPVTVPCVVEKPVDVQALRDYIGREEWDSLSTDQRASLVAAQALARKVFGDKLGIATAGCLTADPAAR